MDIYVPHYYKSFRCIADKCKESCCIGWEIDIDSDTLEMYSKLDGDLGKKLRANITVSEDGSDCFKLGENERCPFLTDNDLCELILSGGEEMLCDICRLHPRFINLMPRHTEMGIGLCCEEAARVILTDNEPFSLEWLGTDDETEITEEPADIFMQNARSVILQFLKKNISIPEKAGTLIKLGKLISEKLCNNDLSPVECITPAFHFPGDDLFGKLELIFSLEPLNDRWKEVCLQIKAAYENAEEFTFDGHYREYTNLLKYYIFRYFTCSCDPSEAVTLAVFSACAAAIISKASGLDITESACLWSKETEYSAENTDMICGFSQELSQTSSFL